MTIFKYSLIAFAIDSYCINHYNRITLDDILTNYRYFVYKKRVLMECLLLYSMFTIYI